MTLPECSNASMCAASPPVRTLAMRITSTARIHRDFGLATQGIWICTGFVAITIIAFAISIQLFYNAGNDLLRELAVMSSMLGIAAGITMIVLYQLRRSQFLLYVGTGFLLLGMVDLIQVTSSLLLMTSAHPTGSTRAMSPEYSIAMPGRLMFATLLILACIRKDSLHERADIIRRVLLYVALVASVIIPSLIVLRAISPEVSAITITPIVNVSALVALCVSAVFLIYTTWKTPTTPKTITLLSVMLITVEHALVRAGLPNGTTRAYAAHVMHLVGQALPLTACSLLTIKLILDQRVELSNTNAKLKTQLDAIDMHDIVAQTDRSGKITMVNDAFVEISGYAREELIGQDHRILNSGTHPKSFFVDLWKTISAGNVWRGVICNRAKDGSLYWVQSTIMPMLDARGSIEGYQAVRTDISVLIKIQHEFQEKNAELERFVYVASHDLKSPLITVLGYIGFLQNDLSEGRTDRIDEFTTRIASGANKMHDVINDLLQISRIGSEAFSISQVDLTTITHDVISQLESAILEHNASISVEPDMPTAMCNPVHIKQVIQNLLTNAIKYARLPDQPLKISVSASIVGSNTEIRVADNGPGIPEKYHTQVFELFKRLKSNEQGTGIGLSIVKRVAEVYNGKVEIRTTPGGGATIALTLPINQSTESQHELKLVRVTTNTLTKAS